MVYFVQLAAGDKVDEKYLIRSVLGAGGFGTVYQATHEALGRSVALKLLTDCTDAEVAARLMREAQALSTIKHRNVIQCFDHGTFFGVPYIAVEFVPGNSLQDELNAELPLPCERALNIVIQICEGLEAAHAQGIVHRDLKPANVLLCKTANGAELVKIIDFGLAKVLPEAGINAKFQQLTDMGLAIGTVRYMSPEQCLGHPASTRSDIYAVGCILYECLTGMRCFDADAAVAVMFKQLNEPPPLLQPHKPNAASHKLQEIINRALAKDVEARYQTMQELRQDLQEVAALKELYKQSDTASMTVAPNAVPKKSDTKKLSLKPFVAAAAACLIAASAAFVFLSQPPKTNPKDCMSDGDRALRAGEYKMASREYRQVLENPNLPRATRTLVQVRLCEALCADANRDEFFGAIDDLRKDARLDAYKLAVEDRNRYTDVDDFLVFCAAATELECSPLNAHDQNRAVCEFLRLLVQRQHGTLLPIADEIAVETMHSAIDRINEAPADFANVYAMRARLQTVGAAYGASGVTTSEILSKLNATKLSDEDENVLKFLTDIHSFNPRQTSYAANLTDLVGLRWLDSIQWMCEYERLCGHWTQAAETARQMRRWCKSNNTRTTPFGNIVNGTTKLGVMGNPDSALRPGAPADLGDEALVKAYRISSTLAKADILAERNRDAEALAYFTTAIDACKRTGCELYKTFFVSSKLADHAFSQYEHDQNAENLKRAIAIQNYDVGIATLAQNDEMLADARFRQARIYAMIGDMPKFYLYWTPAYRYYSEHKKGRVDASLQEFMWRAANRNRALAQLLTDEHLCCVDGVVTFVKPSDLDSLVRDDPRRDSVVARLLPTADHMLRTNKIAEYEQLKEASNRAALRLDDGELLRPIIEIAYTGAQIGNDAISKDALKIGAEFARMHKVSLGYQHSLQLQQADNMYFTHDISGKDRNSELFKTMEASYKADLDVVEKLVRSDEKVENREIAYPDAIYRLARLYIVAGDRESFQPLWNECVAGYARLPSPQALNERVNEMCTIIAARCKMPELAARVKKDALASRERVRN